MLRFKGHNGFGSSEELALTSAVAAQQCSHECARAIMSSVFAMQCFGCHSKNYSYRY
ncbi:MAG: hypothetical protein PUD02_05950 [Eggerthellales bacterium]|nr:hypothetical protein [Eggerthellales bacterium]